MIEEKKIEESIDELMQDLIVAAEDGTMLTVAERMYEMGWRKRTTSEWVTTADVAREIFAEIKEKGSFSDSCAQHIVLSFEELAEIEKKYT